MNIHHMKITSAFILIFSSGIAAAEVKVIANNSVSDSGLSADTIADMFLGKTNSLPSGHKAVPVDQDEGSSTRDEFYTKATKKDAAQLKAYWSRLIFTGKGQPPKVVADDSDVVAQVSASPDAIGYVSGNTNTAGVKVLLTIH